MPKDPNTDPNSASNLTDAANTLNEEIERSIQLLNDSLGKVTGQEKQQLELKIKKLKDAQSGIQSLRSCASGVTTSVAAPFGSA